MRIDELTWEVRDENLNRVGQLLPQDLVGWSSVLRFNNVGTWRIELPGDHLLGQALATPGAGIVVTHRDAGVIFSGPTTAVEKVTETANPVGSVLISGIDDTAVLAERLAYPTPSTDDVTAQIEAHDIENNVPASTAMYGYVRRNMLPGVAPAVRAVPHLALSADAGLGSLVKKSARFDIIGELLSEIAVVDGLGFDIKQQGDELVFNVYEPTDRSRQIRMDVENNTLASTSFGYGRPGLTKAIVAGQGDLTERTFIQVETVEADDAEALWGRRIEQFIDQRNTDDLTELTQAGLEALAESGGTLTSIDVIPSSDQTMAYGSDWNLGDRVTVVVGGEEISATVTQVAISVQADGIRVGATVGKATGVDYDSQLASQQTTTLKRVNALERVESSSNTGSDFGNLDNGTPATVFGGSDPIDAGGV